MKSQQKDKFEKPASTSSKSPLRGGAGGGTAGVGSSRSSLSPPKTSAKTTTSPPKSTIKGPNFTKPQTAGTTRSTGTNNVSRNSDLNASQTSSKRNIPKPSTTSQNLLPKSKAGQKKSNAAEEGSSNLLLTRQASKSNRDLSMMQQQSIQKSPIKGILKKPRKPGEEDDDEEGRKTGNHARFAASDDEQIRKIKFQHQLEMAHKERRQGFFPGEEDDVVVNTDSKNLGFSLLTNSVNQRTGEVDLSTYSLKPPPGMEQPKPINYKNLDWSFKEFMKVQEDMIAKGQIDTAIKNLEDALNERLQIYPAKDEGVWRITQLLGDVTVKTAIRHLNNSKPDDSLQYLKHAMRCTEPLPNSDWSENPEWVALRKSVFKNLAVYHQQKDEWNKALANFQHSLKLDQSPINPDPIGAANTSLTCAIILSKLNKYAESIDYAESCMRAIEDLAGIDRETQLTEYKQRIQKNGTKANGGRMLEHDKMMSTYAISLHLLGNNLGNLKYYPESKKMLQRAQYVASHLMSSPQQGLVETISKSISSLNEKERKKNPNKGNGLQDNMRVASIEETSSALQSIKSNLANHAYSLAADFEEQKALLDELIQKEDDQAQKKGRYDDKALEYVKQFIEEKKKQEKGAIDEYRAKIQKDFDTKQTEFLEKQQKVKKQNALKEESKQKKRDHIGGVGKRPQQQHQSAAESEGDSSVYGVPPKRPAQRGLLARSAGIPETSVKPGDFETEEKRQRVKKSEKNLAAEGAKLDNLGLKYSSEKGKKQYFNKRRLNIEKVNEKLGYFGGGILDNQDEEEVVLQGGTSKNYSPEMKKRAQDFETDNNPFEDQNLQAAANTSIKRTVQGNGSPTKIGGKKTTSDHLDKSDVKLPPVKGYKLDSLGLGELGESVVKKSIDMGYGSDNPFRGAAGYKNPQTRRLLETIENKDYGQLTKAKSFKSDAPDQPSVLNQRQTEAARLEKEHLDAMQKGKPNSIRDIPVYKPPDRQDPDWREEFRKKNDSDDELPDTLKLIAKLNKAQGAQRGQDASVFEESPDDQNIKDDFTKDEINEREIEAMKRKIQEHENAKAAKNSLPLVPIKPPKAKNVAATSSDQGSTRLPLINKKRFQEDKSKSPSTSPERKDTKSHNKLTKQEQEKKSPPQKKSPIQTSKTSPPREEKKSLSSTRKSLLPAPKSKTKEPEKTEDASNNKPAYVPPNKRMTRTQKLALEAKQKEEDEKKSKKRFQKSLDQDEGQQMKRPFDEDRLASLSTPKAAPTPKSGSQDDKRKENKDGAKNGEEKAKEMLEKVQRGKSVDLANYLDRDVPVMTNKTKKKLSRNQSEAEGEEERQRDFDTRMENKPGLFSSMGQEQGKRSGRESKHLSRSQSNVNGGIQGVTESGADQGSSAQKAHNAGRGRGLMADLELQKSGGLTVQGLRYIEKKAAMTIQRFIRGYFTRKWYLNYMMRQKLGVPFSGMEFASNCFLRLFNKPNQLLHEAAMVPPQLIEAVKSTGEQKNIITRSIKHGKEKSQGIPGLIGPGSDVKKSPGPRRLMKGSTPQQLMNDLQNQFVAKGLDAYSQFKNYGVDALTDENGNPTFKDRPQYENEEDKPLDPNQISPRTVNVALDPLERMVPRWRGKNVERFLEVKEVGEYLDRVSRVKEYDEKQKEIMKSQQYQNQARQMRRHEVTTLASFAKAQGVFNRNPNKRNAQEDDEDYDPLAPGRKQDISGDGGPPGDDPSDQDKSPNGSGSDDKNKKGGPGRPVRNIAFKEDDGSIPLKMYQQFSREMICFYKKIGNTPIKWMIQAGIPFVKDRKQYIPIRIQGELQNSRHLLVSYIMNLELLKISADYYQYNTHNFETIWPFILYLFNNWVRYQVQLIHLTDNKPLFGPEEFMAPMEITKGEVEEMNKLHQMNSGLQGAFHANDYAFNMKGDHRDTAELLYNPNLDDMLDLKEGIKEAKHNYDEALNFSSEIEFDERFDLEKYKTLVRPEELLDRKAPKDRRTSAAQIMQGNRRQLFQAYRMQLQEERRKDPIVNMIEVGNSPNKESEKDKQQLLYQMHKEEEKKLSSYQLDEMGRPRKKVRLKLDDIYEPINIANMNPFAKFLELHFVQLPNMDSGQYKLLRSLQMKGYNERQNQNVTYPLANVNQMNEERRKRLGLLPLSVIDYNCIDRAALKLKLILECLYLKRQINGQSLVPRDVREAYIDAEWQRRKLRNLRTTSRLPQFSLDLIKAFGEHVVYAKAYNERQLMIEHSIKKVEDYKSRKQLHSVIALADLHSKEQSKKNSRLNSALKGAMRGDIPKVNLLSLKNSQNNHDQFMNLQEQDREDDFQRSLNEQAVMISNLKEGKNLADTTTIIINEDDLRRGLIEETRNERVKQALAHLNNGQDAPLNNNMDDHVPEEERREEPPVDIPGFNDAGVEPDIQDYIHDGQIFEQGIIRIKGNLYICTLVFKKILSNYENMKSLIEERIKVHAPKSQSHQVEMLKQYKGHLRMKSKLCHFVSTHEDVIRYDEEIYRFIKPTEKLMLESEMSTKERTKYKTFLEVKICSKMSDTIWDDCFNLQWERIYDFYQIFGIKWRLHDLLIKKKMNFRDRFTFFNFFGSILSIRDTLLEYNLQQIDFKSYKYHNIFLKYDELKSWRKQFGHMPFYYDDYLKNNFDECEYDQKVNPYYNIGKAQTKIEEKLRQRQREGVTFDPAELHPNRAAFYKDIDEPEEEDDEAMIQGVHVVINEERKKPGLLVDEATKEYLLENRDHTNMFNLTLTNYPSQDGIFLGRVMLGNPETYRTLMNLKIDYYSVGFVPTLQIKVYNAIYSEAFEFKVYHKPTIKSFIRICNQSNQSMIVNQLQSAITIGRKVMGRYVKLNFNKHHLYLSSGIGTRHGQDFINMSICNENLMRTMLNDNYRQFSGVMYFDNLGGRNLVTISEFEIDMYQQIKGNQSMIHMNKHLSLDQKKDREQMEAQNSLPVQKRYQKVKLWKVNVFNMSDTKTYETVISYDDLHNYYETEFIFQAQANLNKPDLIRLLSDYLRTLYIYRSRVGNLLYWRLPMYKRPLDPKTGLAIDVPPDHMYKLKMLSLYHQLQRKIDGQNRHDEMASVTPVTMDQLKAKRQKREPPSLSLRPKLVGEKQLPIYDEAQALRVLKVTSSISEILLQRPKMYRLSPTHKPVMSLVTVILHPLMECWLWQIYVPQTQRTYTAIFYPSDLFNMSAEIYGKKNKKNQGSAIWIEMIKRSELQRNNAGDIILIIEKFKEPIKEILFQDHVYNDNAQDMFFMEVVMKNHSNFVTEISQTFQPMDAFSQKLNEITVIVRAFSLTRNVWIKDQMPLSELIKILKKENYLMDNVKQLYFSMVRDAAIMLANKIVFSDEAKTSEIKKKALTYDIHDLQTSHDEMEKLKRQHMKDIRRKHTNREGLSEAMQAGLKTEWRNLIDLNKIFYQSVIAENPSQICTITYNDVKELFIYRLYRCSDQSNYEKRIPAAEVARTCAPQYQKMMFNKMFKELGERIALHYKKDMLVASLMTYFRIQQEKEQKERDELEALQAKYKMFEPEF